MEAVRMGRESAGARAALVVVAVAVGVAVVALTPDATDLPPGGRLVPVFAVLIGWGFTGVGVFAWSRRPDNAVGALMAAFGLTALVANLTIADRQPFDAIASVADGLALGVFVHLLLAFPSGRLEDRASRLVVSVGYAAAAIPKVADTAVAVRTAAAIVVAVAAVVLAVRHARAASRTFAPLAACGAAVVALVAVSIGVQALDADAGLQKAAQLAFVAGFATLPLAFLSGLVRSRFFRGAAVSRVVERLGRGGGRVDEILRAALGDPTIAVAYWLPDRDGYVDRDGRPVTPPPGATDITHEGRRVGALVHGGALAEDAELTRAVAGAAGLALENDRLEVELRAQLRALRASRARIVEAGDAERRRLGRDLHDGAQARLVSLLLDLQLARERWEGGNDASRELVERALGNARAAVDELRDLASGIHPAVLSQRGLDAALESLATRAQLPVELDVALEERLPSAVETAAYFVVAEALTNVAKYANATHARVRVRRLDGVAFVEVSDDGVGGADAARGSGLCGLGDRVGALDGTIDLDSPPGRGTLLRARIPLQLSS